MCEDLPNALSLEWPIMRKEPWRYAILKRIWVEQWWRCSAIEKVTLCCCA